MTAAMPWEPIAGPCAEDPDRWVDHPDDNAKAICRACPLRWPCARAAVETPGAVGLWAGVVIPEEGRRERRFAVGQLRTIAEFGGYPVTRR